MKSQKAQAIKIKAIRLTNASVETSLKEGQLPTADQLHLSVDIKVESTQVELDQYAVKLVVGGRVDHKDTTKNDRLLIVEVEYSCILETAVVDNVLAGVLYIKIPEIIFPYCRETIDSLALKAGFASFNIAPFDFERRYKESHQEPAE